LLFRDLFSPTFFLAFSENEETSEGEAPDGTAKVSSLLLLSVLARKKKREEVEKSLIRLNTSGNFLANYHKHFFSVVNLI
jgi:hypothetical protein